MSTNQPAQASEQILDADLSKIINATHHDPFAVLGKHTIGSTDIVRVFLPRATEVQLPDISAILQRIPNTDLFEWKGESGKLNSPYLVKWIDESGHEHLTHDTYSFLPQLSDFDLHLFSEGKHWHAYRILGAHIHSAEGVSGVLFATWAPNAERVSVIGNFNQWDYLFRISQRMICTNLKFVVTTGVFWKKRTLTGKRSNVGLKPLL